LCLFLLNTAKFLEDVLTIELSEYLNILKLFSSQAIFLTQLPFMNHSIFFTFSWGLEIFVFEDVSKLLFCLLIISGFAWKSTGYLQSWTCNYLAPPVGQVGPLGCKGCI